MRAGVIRIFNDWNEQAISHCVWYAGHTRCWEDGGKMAEAQKFAGVFLVFDRWVFS